MKKEHIKPFENEYVKLVQNDGFILYGIVDEVLDDCIRFKTKQAISLISLDAISVIMEMR